MTTAIYYATPDMIENGFKPGAFSATQSQTRMVIKYGNMKLDLTGSFTLSGGEVTGGTLKGVSIYLNGSLKGSVSGASINLLQAANSGDIFGYVITKGFGGVDSITGSTYADTLYGYGGNDTLKGLGGNDRLTGGAGKDTLTGGAGKDIFDFNSASESGLTSTTRDIIADFVRGTDKIDLSGIDANVRASGNNAFSKIIGASTAFTAAGQLKLSGGVLYGNIDSDSAAEFSIQINGVSTLSLADFIL